MGIRTLEFENLDFNDWPCHENLIPISVDEGHDSDVYLYQQDDDDEFAVHVYRRGPKNPFVSWTIDGQKLKFYRAIHNTAAIFCQKEDIKIEFPYSNKEYGLRVVWVLGLRKCPHCSCYESITRYIQGKNLNQYPYEFDRHDIKRAMSMTSEVLNERLGVKGIQLESMNLKMINDIVIVTDLCAKIDDLRKDTWY